MSDTLYPLFRPAAVLCLLLAAAWLGGCTRELQPDAGTALPAAPVSVTPPSLAEHGPATDPAYPAPPGTDPAYPGPEASQTPAPSAAYPGPVPVLTSTPSAATPGAVTAELYLPAVIYPAPTVTPTPTPTNTPVPTPTPTIDFRALQAEVRARGEELAFVKIGFHTGPGGNQTGIGDWMQRLDAAGVPFFLKSVDSSSALVEAQEIARRSDVPHILVYRTSGTHYDVPDYALPPAEAARRHWEQAKAAFPPELDPSLIWLETINEVDQQHGAWLGEFAVHTARLAMQEGYRWAAFGWSAGEPDSAVWEHPRMLEFLRLAGDNPEQLAVALHEYSYLTGDIGHDYPFKVGRFLSLFDVVDRHGIPRPTVLITEWGWAYDDIPAPGEALQDIDWAARLYAPYPEIKGAAIWYLGPGFGEIADQTQQLIAPVTEYALGNYFIIRQPGVQASTDPGQFHPLPRR